MSFKKTTLLTFQPQNAFEILFCLGWRAVLLDTDFFQTASPHLGDGGEDRLWLGAGGRESGLINTLFYPSHRMRIIQMSISQMKSKLSIFSSSDICYGISQKWWLNNHVIKSRFNKNSFHIQFYIMRTIQNSLARVHSIADVEKMNSDGKLHVQINICIHVCLCVFSIRDMPASLSISSHFIFKWWDSPLGVQLLSTPDLTKSDSKHEASSDCMTLYTTHLWNSNLTWRWEGGVMILSW